SIQLDYSHPLWDRQKRCIIHLGMGQRFTKKYRHREHSDNPANELCDDVKHRVPVLDFAETPEAQCDSRVEVRARPFSKRRENQRDGCAAHGDTSQHSSNELARNDSEDGRVRMSEKYCEQTGRDHEDPELSCFTAIFRTMSFERAQHVE